MSKETGGPAFPYEYDHLNNDGSCSREIESGQTLRDHFAGLAMGLCFAQYLNHAEVEGFCDGWRDGVALDAYMMADAMLRARSE